MNQAAIAFLHKYATANLLDLSEVPGKDNGVIH